MSKKMYESFKIDNLEIKNRIVRSAMFEFAANNGKVSEEIIDLYKEVAEGGSGLIITGMQAISATSGYGPVMVETTYDGYIEDMAKIAKIAHENNSKLFVQLQHVGYRTNWSMGYDTFGVSELVVSKDCTYHEATQEEIDKVVRDFGIAAKRCKDAGCDGVQIHAAHGFLINSFLSPHFNHRTDSYGGNIENRAKLLFEIYDSIREAVGKEYLVSVKIPFSDMVEKTSTSEEMLWVCKELEKKGIDMIEVSSGITMDGSATSFTPFVKNDEPEGNFLESAKKVANEVDIPVVSVCGYRTPDGIEKVLEGTKIAAISLGRPLTKEPELPNRWKTDSSRATCISCNRCFGSQGIIACQVK